MTDEPATPTAELPGIAPRRWQCCHCGGTGVDSHGETCEHCEGLGFC
ncbi:hypothetical protein GCM10018953_18000 [Streptosporangium nondiastaticum]